MLTKRNLFLAISSVAAIFLAALTISLLQPGEANAQGTNRCSLKTIKGTWVFQERGFVKDGQKVVPWAAAGVWIFDGAGNSEGLYSASMDGEAIDRQKPFTATYELKPGCVFKAVDSLGIVYDLYSLDQGTTMTYFAAGVSGTMYKR